MAVRSIRAFNRAWDRVVDRQGTEIRVLVEQAGQRVFAQTVAPGTPAEVVLPIR